ncbi:MAG: arsenic metallochaperone ArsD family protein [Nigerium sp.]|nr:arsenic metallochaperone ArsD family protein [Nigerium sp.]
MHIQILGGTHCSPCVALDRLTRRSVAELGLDATVEKVTDETVILAAGILSIPALVVDGTVVVTGRVPSSKELKRLLSSRATT